MTESLSVLSRQQQAAIILSLLDPDQARGLALRFDDGRVERAIAAFETLPVIGRDEVVSTIETFLASLPSDVPLVSGGPKRTRDFALALRLDDDDENDQGGSVKVKASLEDGADPEAVWAYLRSLEPPVVARLVAEERPPVIAEVVRQMGRETSSAILQALPPQKASAVVRLLIAETSPAPPTVEAIAESLRREVPERLRAPKSTEAQSTAELAEVMNTIPVSRQEEILEPLRSSDPEPTARLEGSLLRFGMLHERLPKTMVPALFREADKKALDTALRYGLSADPQASEFLLSCISQRLAEQIRERLDELPPIPQAEGEAAQTAVVRMLLQWAEEDRFAFKPPPGEEEA